MPLPKGLGQFNRLVSNRITRPFAARLPFFGVLHHTGRRTGSSYRTPLLAWKSGARIIVALAYGSDTDWLKNARAADTSKIVMGGATHLVGPPVAMADPAGAVPSPVRRALRALSIGEYVEFPIL